MGILDPRLSTASSSSSSSSSSTSFLVGSGSTFSSLVKPSRDFLRSRPRLIGLFRSLCRTLPVFTPKCSIPAPCKLVLPNLDDGAVPCGQRNLSGRKITATLFGYRKGRLSLSIQETPRCLPSLIVELSASTHVLMKDMSHGMVRIALECEKSPDKSSKLLDEPLWTMFCNGKKSGYGVKREVTDDDLTMMEMLRVVSMGAGVLPGGKSDTVDTDTEGPEGDQITFIRADFEHVIASKDSETLYMVGPEVINNGPELTIFFIRV